MPATVESEWNAVRICRPVPTDQTGILSPRGNYYVYVMVIYVGPEGRGIFISHQCDFVV